MVIYFFKMIACSAILYGFYYFFLSKEKMFVFNRFYLLAGLMASFLIPLITITVDAPVLAVVSYVAAQKEEAVPFAGRQINYWLYTTAGIITIVSAFTLIRFCRNIYIIRKNRSENPSFSINDVRVVLLNEMIAPQSFLKTIFLNKDEYEAGRVEPEVMEHELAHIRQRHSWDILLVELLQVVIWFNPVLYFFKRSIKINHELLADAAVVKCTGDVRSYQSVLLQRAVAQSPLVLASSFHFYTTKKRMIMLTKKTNLYFAGLKIFAILPLTGMLVFIIAEKTYAQKTKPVITDVRSFPRDPVTNEDVEWSTVTYDKSKKPVSVELKLKNKKQVIKADISTNEKVKAFEKKYGVAVIPPPPPAPPKPVSMHIKSSEIISYNSKVRDEKSGDDQAVTIKYGASSLKTGENGSMRFNGIPVSRVLIDGVEVIPVKIVKDDEVKSFAPPKILKLEDVKLNEGTVDIDWNKPKASQFTPPKIVKDNEVKIVELDILPIEEK